jgi:hypothetical protein
MAFSDGTRSPITFFICAIGMAGLSICAWSTLGRLLVVQCETYQQMCMARTEFETIFGQMLRSPDRAIAVFLAGGLTGFVSIAFAMYVGVVRVPSTKILVTIGCCFLIAGGFMQLYGMFAS